MTSISSGQPTRALRDGGALPLLGLGVWQVSDDDAESAVRWALEAGYRHVDTAQAYGNEAGVGRGLAASGVPREEVFVTTKFFPGDDDPVAGAEASLRRLGIDELDLYLVHWPQGGATWAWRGMEQALERGLTRAIGVSNWSVRELDELAAASSVAPQVNQLRLNAFSHRRALVERCESAGIVPEAYSPLTTGRDLADPRVAEVAARVGRTPAQVLLRWALQHGFPVIPKSTHRERIVENGRIFDFELAADDMEALDALDRTGGTAEAVEDRWW